ncbi:hypothetical protein D3C87_539810 [compost metagenome]
MAEPNYLKHIKVDTFVNVKNYVAPTGGDGSKRIFDRDKAIHGAKLLGEFQQISLDKQNIDRQAQEDLVLDDAVYVDFYSAFDYKLAFDSFDSQYKKVKYKLLSITKETQNISGQQKTRYRVTLLLTKGGIEMFVKKLNKYLTANGLEGFSNVEEIKMATLRSFWAESIAVRFPADNEVVWWEVWFRRNSNDDSDIEKINKQIHAVGAIIGEQKIVFPEHIIRLVKASPKQLSDSLMFLDNLSELRKPKEVSEFFTNLSSVDQEDWMNDLINRVDQRTSDDAVAVCILDTGVQNGHPLLAGFLPDANMYSWKSDWGNLDNYPNGGHGTGMAGLAIYGDLTPALSTSDRIQIYHQLESVKILNHRDPNNPQLYGSITEEACNTPVVDFPNRPRVYCLAVTAPPNIVDGEDEYWGRPSSWSAAIDKIAFGDGNHKQLIFVSGGNVEPQAHTDYKTLNETSSIEDPGQAFNAITVGAYTEFDQIDLVKYPLFSPLASRGDLSPSSSTSLMWDSKWSVKPDIVLEGGNYAYNSMYASKMDSLQMLSTHTEYGSTPFQTFGDTSGATALASKMAAELMTEYPSLWPETIRALLIHSADWNEQMLSEPLNTMNVPAKRNLLRVFGYGVPDIIRARHSLKNSLTLIAENKLQPFTKTTSIKYNNFHLYELPWPKDVLRDEVFTNNAVVTVTLSYFIEPNPGNRLYSNTFSYQSHGLGFRMIGKDEDPEIFLKRISKETREEGENGFAPEPWLLGPTTREKGSIQKDKMTMSGADLATRNTIAIYPKAGWYKTREKLGKFDSEVRYSLVISIETPGVDVDLYQPVMNQIATPIII